MSHLTPEPEQDTLGPRRTSPADREVMVSTRVGLGKEVHAPVVSTLQVLPRSSAIWMPPS